MSPKTTLYLVTKRIFDVMASSIALFILSPVLIAVGALIRMKLGPPVLFRQNRPGRDGETFELLKFRTMRNVDAAAGMVSNEQRMTRVGRLLRSSSLDELPSLWNVVKGQMSLVGPRPLLVTYLPLYSERQMRRHEARPGLTGLAQVSGRNSLEWNDRLELDVQYVDRRSWAMDASIMISTIVKVVRRDGIASEGHSVGSPFRGNESGEKQE